MSINQESKDWLGNPSKPSEIVSFDFEIRTISHDNVRLPASMSFVQELSAAQTRFLSLKSVKQGKGDTLCVR